MKPNTKLDDPHLYQKAREIWKNLDIPTKTAAKELDLPLTLLYNTFWKRWLPPPKYTDEYILERYDYHKSQQKVALELWINKDKISRIVRKYAHRKPKSEINTFRWEVKQDDEYWKRKWFEIRFEKPLRWVNFRPNTQSPIY